MSPYGYTVYRIHTPRLGNSMNNLGKSKVQRFCPPQQLTLHPVTNVATVNQALDLIPCPGIHEHTRHTLSCDMLLTLDLTHLALFSDICMIFS